jgi:hypothetical protein
MEDVNASNALRHLTHGQVKVLEYSRYDINEYHFRTTKLEASHPLGATTNNGVVTSGEDATNYYCILTIIFEYTFGGAKELSVVFFNVIGLIQSTTLKCMISIWWRFSTNHAIQGPIFCLHIRRNKCTTLVILTQA